jgi:hypothetical protein
MPIAFDCPHCGRAYRVADANAGARFACKACAIPIHVPGGVGAPSALGLVPPAAPKAPAGRAAKLPDRAGVARQKPPLAAPQLPGGPKTRGPNFIFLGGAAAMTIGFFLPWISIGMHTTQLNFGGYELPGKFIALIDMSLSMVKSLETEESMEKLSGLRSRAGLLYAIYLIPVLCVLGAIEELTALNKGRNWWWVRAVAAASPVIAFVAIALAFSGFGAPLGEGAYPSPSQGATSSEHSAFDFIGFGVWVTALGFVAAIVGTIVSPKPRSWSAGEQPRSHPPGPPRPAVVPAAQPPVIRPPVPRPPRGERRP